MSVNEQKIQILFQFQFLPYFHFRQNCFHYCCFHYYQLAEGNISDYKFTIDGKEVQPIQSGDSNVYYIELNNIIAPDLEKAHIFTAGNITVSNYSALSYVNKALDSEKSSENNKKTAAALYLYWKAAEAYFS